MMRESSSDRFVGLDRLFDEAEIKGLFFRYLHMIILVELVLFLTMLAGFAADPAKPFPTKLYLFLAFGIPLAITFLLGVGVHFFRHHLFAGEANPGGHTVGRAVGTGGVHAVRAIFGRLSFSGKLMAILIAAIFLYRLEDMVALAASAGSRTFDALLLLAVILASGSILLGLGWLWFSYRLKIRKMDHRHQYRRAVLERLDLVMLEDETLVDRSGAKILLHDAETAPPPRTPSIRPAATIQPLEGRGAEIHEHRSKC